MISHPQNIVRGVYNYIYVFKDCKMHVVVLGNGPHVISLPTNWGPDHAYLKRRIQFQEARLSKMLQTISISLRKRKNSGEIIYYLDTMPVYINSAGSAKLTEGVMLPFPYEKQ